MNENNLKWRHETTKRWEKENIKLIGAPLLGLAKSIY